MNPRIRSNPVVACWPDRGGRHCCYDSHVVGSQVVAVVVEEETLVAAARAEVASTVADVVVVNACCSDVASLRWDSPDSTGDCCCCVGGGIGVAEVRFGYFGNQGVSELGEAFESGRERDSYSDSASFGRRMAAGNKSDPLPVSSL